MSLKLTITPKSARLNWKKYALLSYIKQMATSDGTFLQTAAQIAETIEAEEQSIQRGLRDLLALGLLKEVEPRHRDAHGWWVPATYRLTRDHHRQTTLDSGVVSPPPSNDAGDKSLRTPPSFGGVVSTTVVRRPSSITTVSSVEENCLLGVRAGQCNSTVGETTLDDQTPEPCASANTVSIQSDQPDPPDQLTVARQYLTELTTLAADTIAKYGNDGGWSRSIAEQQAKIAELEASKPRNARSEISEKADNEVKSA